MDSPVRYFNRELSLLEFHDRVLVQALDEQVPLLERLRFLCISSTNLDEFFEVRVGALKQKMEANLAVAGADGLSPQHTMEKISERAHTLVAKQYQVLNKILIPLLEQQQIRIVKRSHWTPAQRSWLRQYFEHEVLPVLSPIGLDPAHPFPRILNKSLNFLVELSGKDAFGRNSGLAVVQCPRMLPEMIRLPMVETASKENDFVFMSSIIHAFMDEIFYGMSVKSCYQFRVTRNSDLLVDEEETQDLRRTIEGELIFRQYGDEVRLEVADNCPEDQLNFLTKQFEVTELDVYRVNGPVNLNRLGNLIDRSNRSDLLFQPFTPRIPRQAKRFDHLLDAIQQQDILLHHPFDSFKLVVDFIRQAAKDPDVVAIKQTLYRTGANSAIVEALVMAARAGKEVTVVIELLARFDEEANVAMAAKLQEVGIHVVYGVVGYKTHAKMVLVVRRERNKLRHYVHLGTGNYHARTATIYTDYGLLTCNKEIGEDVYRLFLQLTSLGKVSKLERLYQSPFTLHRGMMQLIDREIALVKSGKQGLIVAKMNSLNEQQLCDKLYEASQAGVQIELIIRGVCQLRPGVPGLSENIRVRSIVGRFLEHTRVFYFANMGEPDLYCASADWMERNMFQRFETCFPVLLRKHRDRIIADLQLYLADNTQSWLLQCDGSYLRHSPGESDAVNAQMTLLAGRPGKDESKSN